MFTRCILHLQRLRFRALATPLVIALISGSIPAWADSWPLRPYYYFLHRVAMGQPEAALAQFADDAVVIAGPLCTAQRPCVGKAEIRARYIAPLLTRPRSLPLVDARFHGGVLRVYGGPPRESRKLAKSQRRADEHLFEFRDGLIGAVRAGGAKSDITTATLTEGSAPFAAPAAAKASQ